MVAQPSYRGLFVVLFAVSIAFLAFMSLKSALPQSGPMVELAVTLFQFLVAVIAAASALKLAGEGRVEAPLYLLLGWAFALAAIADLVYGVACFGFGFDWQRAVGTSIELAYHIPHFLFFLLSVFVLMLMMGDLNVGNPFVVGWAISLTFFVASFVFIRAALAHSHLPRQTQALSLIALGLECSIAGFGILPMLFAGGARFRMISAGIVAMGMAAFLFQIVGIYRVLGFLTTAFDMLWTVGEILVVFGLIVAREESSAYGGPRQGTPVLPLLRQLT